MSEGEQPTGEWGDHDQKQTQHAGGEAVLPELPLGEAWGESITSGRAAEWRVRESRSLPVLGEGMVLRSSIQRRIKGAERPAAVVTGG